MYLKRLEIQGFKTFAGRTVIEFRPGLTAIVGPNGSGKSNVADAVRWVLGEQSFATLRCKRTEELLFSGGHRRAPAGLAEVSLTFDNSDRLLPLQFDEVTFTRRATRAGENEYFINRAKVRLKDILEATEPLGGSYTIINQGLVDTALTLRPEERRRLFEDAAEIGSFEARKHETERRLRETDGNMQRVADLLSELEPRVRSLRRQAGQARQHKELSAELHTLLREYYARLWHEAQQGLAAAERQAAASAAALTAARSAQTNSAAALRAVRAALRELRERLGGLHQQSSELHTQAEAAQRELAVGNERHAALARRVEEGERAAQELAAREEEARRELTTAREALAAAEATLAERRGEVQSREAALAQQEAARRELARQVALAQDASLKAATALAQQRTRGEQLAAQRVKIQSEQATLDGALAEAQARHAEAQRQVEGAQGQLDAARAAVEEAQRAEEAARRRVEALRRERGAADEALAAARRALADAEARRESLERLARSYAGVFAGVKAAMQWAERSGRNGFVLVASVVRTPPQLETAIEVALGSRLQNIIVERWQDAEDAIAELKRSGAGRATFMPLDTIRGQGTGDRGQGDGRNGAQVVGGGGASDRSPNPQSPIPNPQSPVLGLAAELVEYDPHYRAVVFQLLGRTLVVRDLQTARGELRRMSSGWVIVTLGGEQVNTGGAVTGGAQTRESGALRRERELRELPGQVAAAQRAVADAEERRRTLADALAAAEREQREAEALRRERARALDGARATLDGAQRAAARAEQELGWQRSRRESAERDLVALREQEAALHDALLAAAAAAEAAEARLAQLRVQQEVESGADSAAQNDLAALRAALATLQGEASAGRTLTQGLQQSLDRLARQREEGARQLAALANERTEIAAQRAAAETRHGDLLAQIDQLREQIGPAEEALAEHESYQAALEADEAARTAALLECEAAHGSAALELQRAHDRIETLGERAAADGLTGDWGQGAGGKGPGTGDRGPGDNRQGTGEPVSQSPIPNPQSPIPDLQAAIVKLRERIARLGAVNALALEEYEEAAERQQFLTAQLADLRQAQDSLRELIAALETAMADRFLVTFHAVAAEFERSFTQLFGGGSAQLRLVGGEGDAAETNGASNGASNGTGNGVEHPPERRAPLGVEVIARPPGKRQQNISLLSGGERTLTAAALLFAILKVNPSPFCILDEMDAALDESNVGRFRDALVQLGEHTQFIVITHNRGTIEAASTLYGISMGDDSASRVLSLKLEELVEEV